MRDWSAALSEFRSECIYYKSEGGGAKPVHFLPNFRGVRTSKEGEVWISGDVKQIGVMGSLVG